MATGQRFVLPNQFAVDATGVPFIGGQLFFYLSGTSTPSNTYQDIGLTIPNSNPVIADSAGRFGNVFLLASAYKVVLEDQFGNVIWTLDPVTSSPASSSVSFTQAGTGAVTRTVQAKLGEVVTPGDFGAPGVIGQSSVVAIVQAQADYSTITYSPAVYLIDSNLTLTGTAIFVPGALLWVNIGVTLTVNCKIVAQNSICISGPGTVTFGQEASSDGWRPEWFGGKPSQIAPTGTIAGGGNSLVVSSTADMEVGAGIAVFGAGASPSAPTGLALVNNAGSGTNYNVQVAAVLANSGVSSATGIVSIASGATPNITASWNAVINAVLYLVFVNNVLVGATQGISFSIGSVAPFGALFNGCPTTPPASPLGGWFTSIIKAISLATITLNDNAISSASAQTVRLDATNGLQRCLTAADLAYGFGSGQPGTLGNRTNSILLMTGLYNIFNTLTARGMFSIIGQGGNWITGSVIAKNQIYSNAMIVEGSSADGASIGCTFDKWQMTEANTAYVFTPGPADYWMRFLGWNGTAVVESNSVYFLSGMRYSTLNAIWMSHGDDWQVAGTSDGGLNFLHQQLDAGVPVSVAFTDSVIGPNLFQPQQVGIFLQSANGVTFTGGRYNNVVSAAGNTGNNASAIIQFAPSGGTAVDNIAITGNTFLNTRTVLNAGQSSGVTFSGNSVGGLAGTGLVLSGANGYNVGNNTFNFQSGQSFNFIAFNPSSTNTNNNISNNVFDMTNTSAQYAITAGNAAGNNTVLTSSKVRGNTVTGSPTVVRAIDWADLASDIEVTASYSFSGSYPSGFQFGTLSAMQGGSSAIIDLAWNSVINKSGVSAGCESGFSTILLAQAGGASGTASAASGTPVAVRGTAAGGSADASPTTTYTVGVLPTAAPGNATGGLNFAVTCPAAGGAMASPTTVSTTLTLKTRGQPSTQGSGTFAVRLS